MIHIPKLQFRTIALNNVINPGSPTSPAVYGFTQAELDYLKKQLQTSPHNTVLAMHAQPNAGRWEDLDGFPVYTSSSQRFFHLISKYRRNVKKVMVSHVHAYDEQFLKENTSLILGNGTDFIVSGGAGAPLEPLPLTYNNYHFLEHLVSRQRISSPDLWRVFHKG